MMPIFSFAGYCRRVVWRTIRISSLVDPFAHNSALFPPNLAIVVAEWPELPEAVRQQVVAMAPEATSNA